MCLNIDVMLGVQINFLLFMQTLLAKVADFFSV